LVLNRITKPDQAPQSVTIPTEFINRQSCRALDDSGVKTARESMQKPQQDRSVVAV